MNSIQENEFEVDLDTGKVTEIKQKENYDMNTEKLIKRIKELEENT